MLQKEEILKLFSLEIRQVLARLPLDFERLQEIRLRVNAPILCIYQNQEFYISREGMLTKEIGNSWTIPKKEIQETLEYIGNYSLYAYEDEVRQGFLTVQGGHRVGIAGKAIVEKGCVKALKYISFLNVRFAHEVKGCANQVLPYLSEKGRVCNTLIVSPPRCGKTTLLRDCIRQFSNGTCGIEGQTIGVVDQRSELGGCYLGIPQNDLGIRTDVLDCCPKTEGIFMLVRSMSPQVIAVDEVGTYEEAKAIETALSTGCKLLATVHGSSIEDIQAKQVFQMLLKEEKIQRYVLLSGQRGVGTLQAVYNGKGERLC